MTDKIEILAPAGGIDCVFAAVRSGADAVYLGAKDFSARSSAKNFSFEELKSAVDYCKISGVKVYLTVNTLILDSELESALKLIMQACKIGIDAVIIQDLGLARLVKAAVPTLALHASTQMTVHTPSGAEALYEAGFKRAVLARELSREEIAEIRRASPIELEVFVHGALCMCVSGQCYFSSMLGARSGNRGACAQPCRLPFSIGAQSGYPLSLKDNSIADKLRDLQSIGVTSAKIEGRMKRPEYVAAAVSACKQARDLGYIDPQTTVQLNSVFSRTGFTDGYYSAKTGREMFGFRRKEDVVSASEKLLSQIREGYRHEAARVAVDFDLSLEIGRKPKLTVSDGINFVTVFGENEVQTAVNLPTNEQTCIKQLSKTGSTPYYAKDIKLNIENGCAVSASALNFLRRASLEQLSQKRCKSDAYEINDVRIPKTGKRGDFGFGKRIRLMKCENLPVLSDFDMVIVPLFSDTEIIKAISARKIKIAAEIPRCMFSLENKIKERLTVLKKLGINDAVAHNIGAIKLARTAGFTVHGGFGLNITNSMSVLFAEKAGLADAELSFELNLEQIKNISGNTPLGIISYGRVPLMITRNCPKHSFGVSCAQCSGKGELIDRKNFAFPFACENGTTQIYNSLPIVLSENIKDMKIADFEVYNLTFEENAGNLTNSGQIAAKAALNEKITNGLYHRGFKNKG